MTLLWWWMMMMMKMGRRMMGRGEFWVVGSFTGVVLGS